MKTNDQLLNEIITAMANTLGTVFSKAPSLKTNQQLLDEITAAMADVWLAACERRVIASCLDKFVVLDTQKTVAEAPFGVFGPASTTECQTFVHRAAALDVLRMLGTERVAKASFAAANGELHAV